MALTVNNVAHHLRYDADSVVTEDLQHLLDSAEQMVKDHILTKYDAENKTARMLLQGACSGCPSSTATLKNGIENILKQFVPDLVEKVEAVNG